MNGDCFSTKITLLTPNCNLSVLYPGKRLRDWDKRAENAVPVEVRTGKENEYMGLDFASPVYGLSRNTSSEPLEMQEERTTAFGYGRAWCMGVRAWEGLLQCGAER